MGAVAKQGLQCILLYVFIHLSLGLASASLLAQSVNHFLFLWLYILKPLALLAREKDGLPVKDFPSDAGSS